MEEKLVIKMIRNCLKQYYAEASQPISESDYKGLCLQIYELKENNPEADLHDIINDVVYEFLTG